MKPEVGKFYNIHYVAPDKRGTSYTGIGECVKDCGDIFVFWVPTDQVGMFQEEDILSELNNDHEKKSV
jgi:hypothetical protein